MAEENNNEIEEIEAPSREFPLAAWAGVLLVLAALFAVAAVVAFGSLGRNSPWAWSFAALGVLALLGWFFGRRKSQQIRGDEYSKQRALLGVNAFMSVLLLLVLLVGVNYIAARRHKTFDLTQNKINSLAEQSHNALDGIDGRIRMTYVYANSPFGGADEPNSTVSSLLNTYKNTSDKVQVEYVNAGLDPATLQDLNLPTFSGQPVLLIEQVGAQAEEGATARQEVPVVDEQNITSALLKIANPQQRTLYFLTGHGELAPGSAMASPPSEMGQAQQALENQNYALQPLSLFKQDASVPQDAAALIIAGPQTDISESEERVLSSYIENDGRLVLMLSAQPSQPQPRLKNLAQKLGIEVLDGFVFDFEQMYGSPQQVVGPEGGSGHPLLRGVRGNVVFPGVRPLVRAQADAAAPEAGPSPAPLYESSEQSVRAAGAQQLQEILQGGQIPAEQGGPFLLAAAYQAGAPPPMMPGMPAPEAPADGARAVVIGSADILRDGAFQAVGNSSFVLAAVNWAVGDESLVSIPPKPPADNTIDMPERTRLFAILTGLFVLPVLVLIIGTVVWWKRR